MEWNIKNNPTFKDISENRSPYFLTVRNRSAFVAKDYYNSKLDKWFKTSDCVEEVPVKAWMPTPEFDYDLINNESELQEEKMNRETLYNLVEERINDIFLEYQAANDIKSGDITPLQTLQLEELQNKLTDLIMNVGSENK